MSTLSHSDSASVLCDHCHQASAGTALVSFTRNHSFGRKKHICKPCRLKMVRFLKQSRTRHNKSA